MRLRPSLLVCAVAATLAQAACSSPPATTNSISFNISEDPHSLDPLLAQSDDEQQIAHLAFDMLIDVNAQGELIPALATEVPSTANGGVSKDGRTITYHLHHGVRWQDGKPFTSHDVWFTWRAIMDPRNEVASTRGYDLIESIRTPDAYTAIVTLKHAWAPAVSTFFSYGVHPVPIVPAHILEGHPLQGSSFDERPIGTGPYEVAAWQRGDHITYKANPYYYRSPPKTPEIIVHEVPDINTDLTMLRTGDLDWSLLSPAQRVGLGDATDIRFVFAPFAGFGAMAYNCRRPPFDDLRMREAIALSIDRATLSRDITHGQYPVTDVDQPLFSWAHDANAKEPAYDPVAADTMLDALGWRRGPDGMRRKDGKPLSLVFATFPEGDTAVRTSIMVQAMLRQRGIDVTVKKVTVAQFYLPKSEHGLLLSGDYDLAYLAWRSGEDPDDSDLVTCDGISNFAGYCDPAIDADEAKALAITDRAKRVAYYDDVQERMARGLPYLFLYAPLYSFAVRDDVKGVKPSPFSPTWNAAYWVRTTTKM